MATINELESVMSTEADLTEALVDVLKKQQKAIIQMDSKELAATIEKQQELMMPIEGLERERIRISKSIFGSDPPGVMANNRQLADFVGEAAAATRVTQVRNRLRHAVEQIVQINLKNKVLIDHSRKFVRHTLKIVTDGFSKNLVDHKV